MIFRARKLQNFSVSFSSSELSTHQVAPNGVIAHWQNRRALQLIRAECSSNGCPKSVRRSPVLLGRSERQIGFFIEWAESLRTRTSIKLHPSVAPTPYKELPQAPQGTTALSTSPFVRAGYVCRNNTTSLRRPEAVEWAPSVWQAHWLPPFGDCGPVATRHRAMADGTKRTPRDLGAAPPDQKPARPASQIVRVSVHCSARKKRGGLRTPLRTRGRGPKDPAAQTLSGVVAPFQAPARLLRQLLVHDQDRCGNGSPHRRQAAIPSRSRDFDPRRVDSIFVTPSGCGRHCVTPFLRRVRRRSGSQTLQK